MNERKSKKKDTKNINSEIIDKIILNFKKLIIKNVILKMFFLE